jgi:regulator of protease activity HflC (stomatin/prohibitin superfamily)
MSDIKFSTNKNGAPPAPFKSGWLLPGVIVVGLIILALNCFTFVTEGFIGVRYRFNAVVQSDLQPGLQFKIPFIEDIKSVDMREQNYVFYGNAFTKDNQQVNELHLRATYRFQGGRVRDIISDVGINNVDDRYFDVNLQRIAKIVIGQYVAEDLVQNRGKIQNQIETELAPWLEVRGVSLTAFSIENINFEAAFLDAVESKNIAQQKALEAERRTVEREHEATQRVIAAQAEADSVLVKAEAEAAAIALIQAQIARNPEYIDYLKIINWDGILPQVIGDGVNPFVVLGSENSRNNNNNNNNTGE